MKDLRAVRPVGGTKVERLARNREGQMSPVAGLYVGFELDGVTPKTEPDMVDVLDPYYHRKLQRGQLELVPPGEGTSPAAAVADGQATVAPKARKAVNGNG